MESYMLSDIRKAVPFYCSAHMHNIIYSCLLIMFFSIAISHDLHLTHCILMPVSDIVIIN